MEGGGAEAFLGAGVGAGIVIEAVAPCGGTVALLGEAVALCGGTVALLGGAVALFRRILNLALAAGAFCGLRISCR